MAVIAKEDVQQWVEQTKLRLTDLPTDLEATARAIAFSIVGQSYDTSDWIDPSSTPAAVKAAIGLLVAAWYYERAYSENDGVGEYGLHLEAKGMALLDGIASGENDLTEVPGTVDSTALAFWPNDSTGSAEIFNGSGVRIGSAGSEDIKFWMGKKW